MITEEHLNFILKEMEYQLLGLAREVQINEMIPSNVLQEKIIMLKHHIDWIRVDIELDVA